MSASPPLQPEPSVVNHVSPALQQSAQQTTQQPPRNEGEPVYTSVKDPTAKRQAEAAPRDWTIRRPEAEKPKDPPPKPISQVLLDHLKTMWTASASAIQVEQVKNQVTPPEPAAPNQLPGDLAKEILTYQPARIKKTENI